MDPECAKVRKTEVTRFIISGEDFDLKARNRESGYRI
jgi:hypothetical protein